MYHYVQRIVQELQSCLVSFVSEFDHLFSFKFLEAPSIACSSATYYVMTIIGAFNLILLITICSLLILYLNSFFKVHFNSFYLRLHFDAEPPVGHATSYAQPHGRWNVMFYLSKVLLVFLDVFVKDSISFCASLLIIAVLNYVSLIRMQPYYSASFTHLRAGLLMATIVGSIIALISLSNPTAMTSSIILIVLTLPAYYCGRVLSIQTKRFILQRTLDRIDHALESKRNERKDISGNPKAVLRTAMILETEEEAERIPTVPKEDSVRYNFLDVVSNMSAKADQIFNSPFDVEMCARFIITSADPAAVLVMHKIFELGLQEWKLSGLLEVRTIFYHTCSHGLTSSSLDSLGQIFFSI